MLQTAKAEQVDDEPIVFQSPYGGIGASDGRFHIHYRILCITFQSPYGGIGASDSKEKLADEKLLGEKFQSPYGGIGASDFMQLDPAYEGVASFQSPYGGIGASDRCS